MPKKEQFNYVKPVNYILDIICINLFALFILPQSIFSLYFAIFISIAWAIIALNINFYAIFRYTKIIEILNKIVKQFFFFTIIYYSFLGFYAEDSSPESVIYYISLCMISVTVIKFTIFYLVKKFRSWFGGAYKRIIIIGTNDNMKLLSELFTRNFDYGYHIIRVFEYKEEKRDEIQQALQFAIENDIDEVYISMSKFLKAEINEFIDFSENYLKTVKFVPETKEIFDSNLKLDYYGYVPVLSLNKTVLHDPVTAMFKRIFDIIFSFLVIIFVLSWLTPLLAILIRIESRGPIFFKQGRPGIDEREFFCYKFRSMKINKTTEKEASKNDPRVTKIGRIIRKTSLDEMPQFLNVLFGDMSVVGPRPHLWSQNKAYGSRINKYMVRHYVKPGITGLAQVRGYRGEIETDEDMIKRIQYDVYYIENWSVILDLKIIVQTVVNIFKGEEKAY